MPEEKLDEEDELGMSWMLVSLSTFFNDSRLCFDGGTQRSLEVYSPYLWDFHLRPRLLEDIHGIPDFPVFQEYNFTSLKL